jgi:hypothetical protein
LLNIGKTKIWLNLCKKFPKLKCGQTLVKFWQEEEKGQTLKKFDKNLAKLSFC